MLLPEYLNSLPNELLEIYGKLDESILRDIVRRLVKAGKVTDTARWQIDRLQDGGLLKDDIITTIAKYSDACEAQVKSLFENAGVTSVEYERSIYGKAGLAAPPIRMSPQALELLKAGMWKTNGELKNMTLTTAITSQQAYIEAAAMAEMQIERGMLDYQTAIRRAVQDASKTGTWVSYPSGHRDRLDVAVRRAALTGTNQTMGKVSLLYAEEFGCDIMELTAHAGARPDHAAWQGGLVSLSGKRGYWSLAAIGYGSGPGFMGWGCRHNWGPFLLGISRRNYSPGRLEELNAKRVEYNGKRYTDYEASQIQRGMERGIREEKRLLAGLDEGIKQAKDDTLQNGLRADFNATSVKLKEKEAALRDMLEQTKRLPDSSRMQVQGFSHSQAGKAVWSSRGNPAKIAFDVRHVAKEEASKLPNHKQAVIPVEKLEGYALNKNHPVGKDKAIAFVKYLGYTVDNQDELIKQVRQGLDYYKTAQRTETQYGKPFEVAMMLKGPNGQYAKVKTGWIVDKGSEIPRLVTIYISK